MYVHHAQVDNPKWCSRVCECMCTSNSGFGSRKKRGRLFSCCWEATCFGKKLLLQAAGGVHPASTNITQVADRCFGGAKNNLRPILPMRITSGLFN